MELHKTQIGILSKLLFAEKSRYKDLKIDPTIENNTFQFHLDKVVTLKLVKQNEDETYSLTIEGKKIANHINTTNNSIIERRKISVHLYCLRDSVNGMETLIYTRKKHPFYGKQGFPAGKVLKGEKFIDAAKRELKEETNLEGNPVLFNIVHYLVKDNASKELLDDKLFLDFFIKNPINDLVESEEGEYKWIPIKNLEKCILKPFNSIETYTIAMQRILNFDGIVNFEEFEHLTNDF